MTIFARMSRITRLSGVLLVVALAVCAAGAATVAEQVAAVRAEIRSNSVDRSTACHYYKAWFVDQCTKAELDALLARNVAAYRRWMELEPKNPAPHSELGCVYAAAGKWDKARPELEVAIAAGKRLDLLRYANCRWEMANCLWKEGDKDGAKKLVAEVAAIEWPSWIPAIANRARYLHRAWTDPDAELDAFKLPHSVDGKPFPTPQEAKYGEKKVSLAKVEIRVNGVRDASDARDEGSHASHDPHVSQDPIIRLLKKKLTRFGSKFEKGGTPIEIEISPDAPVDKPQGYSLDVANGKVVVKARTRLGLTYGVVSLIQCVERRDIPSICEMAIRDWPKCLVRGVTNYWMPDLLEYALFSKMSAVSTMLARTENGVAEYTLAPIDRERVRIVGERFRDFGIALYGSTRGIAMRPLVPLSSERVWKNHLAWARFQASCGIDNTLELDDERFPLHPLDLKAAGSGANLDAKFLTRLHREVKKDYPGHRTMFCPPFYWGPDSKPNYPEEREPYLKSLGDFLDKEIYVAWCGASVKSDNMKESEVEWEKGLIGRKPVIAHNGDCIGRHHFIEYGADPTGFKESHCSNILDLVEGFFQNTSRYQESPEVFSSMDWAWNPDGHDATTAVRRTDEQLEGPGVYEILRDATPALAYFDKYKFGKPHSELFTEDAEALSRRLAVAEEAWSNVLAIAKNKGLFVGDFSGIGLKCARKIVEYRRNPPDWLVKQHEAAMAATSFAENEAGFDKAAGDQFVPAAAMAGGYYVEGIGDSKRGFRNVKYVRQGFEVTGSFECDPFPPKRAPKMVICARSFLVEPPEIEVEVNGHVVFRGKAFKAYYFTNVEFELPFDALARNCRFVIRPVETPDKTDKPFPMIHYVVIKK